jgi:hypothetical protein
MQSSKSNPGRYRLTAALSLASFALLSGCATQVATVPSPAPELALLSSDSFALADECKPGPGDVYRAEFTVGQDGRVSSVRTAGGESCARDALERWVSSFRYVPPPNATPTVVDWMLVEGKRG